MKLTKLFLEKAYPTEEGWQYSTGESLHGKPIAFVLRNGQFCALVPEPINKPYVTLADISEAENLKKRFAGINEDIYVEVVLVYKELLIPLKPNLPKDIVVLSVTENQDTLTKRKKHEVCQN